MSDMTPKGRWSQLQKIIPLDLIIYSGLFRLDAWERYFHNESFYSGYTEEEFKLLEKNPFGNFDLTTADGRQQFEHTVNRYNELFPYTIAKPGEQIDFNTFYAREALLSGRDISGFDHNLIAKVKQ